MDRQEQQQEQTGKGHHEFLRDSREEDLVHRLFTLL
jgi:hypothetical protein